MRAVTIMAMKDIHLLLRDRMGFFFVFFFPLLYGVFFGAVFAGQAGDDGEAAQSSVRVAVVDLDNTKESAAFVALLQEEDTLDVSVMDALPEARTQVRQGRLMAAIALEPGFGAAAKNPFTGEAPNVRLAVDPSRRAEGAMLEGVLMGVASKRMQSFFSDPTTMRATAADSLAAIRDDNTMNPLIKATLSSLLRNVGNVADALDNEADADEGDKGAPTSGPAFQLLDVEHVNPVDPATTTDAQSLPMNSYAISFPQAILWGVMGAAAAFGISLVTERTHGTMDRLRGAPVTTNQILASKALACFLTVISVCTVMLLVARLVFGVTPVAPVMLLFAVFSVAICFVGVMQLLSVLGRTEQSTAGAGWATLLVMAMIGGGMIPLFVMPAWMRTLSDVSPVKWSILAIEGGVWRDFSLAEMAKPIAILLSSGALAYVAGVAILKRRDGV